MTLKTLVILTLFLLITTVKSQSVLTLGPGTSLGVLTGTDLCANIINNSGVLYGGGTICGGLVALEPVASNELPVSFDVFQNYPNPFNPVTMIKYQLPKAGYLSIRLFDMLGREVGVLFEGIQQAGYYQATIDGTNLSSGMYFCRISSGEASRSSGQGFTKVIKMSLIK